jgi:hypothetical protein
VSQILQANRGNQLPAGLIETFLTAALANKTAAALVRPATIGQGADPVFVSLKTQKKRPNPIPANNASRIADVEIDEPLLVRPLLVIKIATKARRIPTPQMKPGG